MSVWRAMMWAGQVCSEQQQNDRKIYWQWFLEHYSAGNAMRVIEEAVGDNGRIRWIDYRLPPSKEGDTLHLQLVIQDGTFRTNR